MSFFYHAGRHELLYVPTNYSGLHICIMRALAITSSGECGRVEPRSRGGLAKVLNAACFSKTPVRVLDTSLMFRDAKGSNHYSAVPNVERLYNPTCVLN